MEGSLNAPLSEQPVLAPAINIAFELQRQISNDKGTHEHTAAHDRRPPEGSFASDRDSRLSPITSGGTEKSGNTSDIKSPRSVGIPQTSAHTHFHRPRPGGTKISSSKEIEPSSSIPTCNITSTNAEQRGTHTMGHVPQGRVDFPTRATEVVTSFPMKAHHMDIEMENPRAERNNLGHFAPGETYDLTHARTAAQSKSTTHKRSNYQVSPTNKILVRPSTAFEHLGVHEDNHLRRSKSSDALHRSPVLKTKAHPEQPPSTNPRFFCIFCQKRFSIQEEWENHERMTHLPEDIWVCCPDVGDDPNICPFCEEINPTPLHLAYHNYQSCRSKSLYVRTFGRKDDLLQHVSQIHKVDPYHGAARLTEIGRAWRSPSLLKECHEALHCGFCGLTLASYQDRTEHVSRHFLEGADMNTWWKDRVSHDVQMEHIPDDGVANM